MSGEQADSKRGRVRHQLLEPLEKIGFRKMAKVSAEVHAKTLTKLADNLAYMSDHSFEVMFDMLKTKGQGRARDVWPSFATILSMAELVEPRPIVEMPSLLRWFRSVEGPNAMAAGTLCETWLYFQRHKKPPINSRLQIERDAQDNKHKRELYAERKDRGSAAPDELDWLKRYEKRLAYCTGIVTGGMANRAAGDAA